MNIPNTSPKRNNEQTISPRQQAAQKASTISLLKHDLNTLKTAPVQEDTNIVRRGFRNSPKREYSPNEYKNFKRRETFARLLEHELNPKLKRFRTVKCGKCIQHGKDLAMVTEDLQTMKSHMKDVMLCGSVWLCSHCMCVISEKRRREIETALEWALKAGYSVYLATFTHSHHQGTPLKVLMDKASKAKSRTKEKNIYDPIKEEFHILHTINKPEHTNGCNGWHFHYHELYITETEVDINKFDAALRKLWKDAAAKQGLTMNEHGFRLQKTNGKIADYIAKTGHQPKDPSKLWGIAEELSKSHLKKSRSQDDIEGMTIIEMLDYIAYMEDTPGLDAQLCEKELKKYKYLLLEYAQATYGKRSVVFSKGFKAAIGIEEIADQDLVNQKDQRETSDKIGFDREAFKYVVGNAMLREILVLDPVELKIFFVSQGADPYGIKLMREEYKERYAKATGAIYISDAMQIAPEEAQKAVEVLDIVSTKIRERHPNEQTEAEESILYRMQKQNLVFTYNACPVCSCRIKRKVLTVTTCANCEPSALWSHQTLRDLNNVAQINRYGMKQPSAREGDAQGASIG